MRNTRVVGSRRVARAWIGPGWAALLLALLLVSAPFAGGAGAQVPTGDDGGGPPPPPPVGSFEFKTLLLDGRQRSYWVYKPTTHNPAVPTSLVIVMHGLTEDGEHIAGVSRFNQLAETGRFIAVYPNGSITRRRSGWKASDVPFLDALITRVERDYNIDPRRVYATGSSVGGAMAYTLACQLADRIAAIGPVGGTMLDDTATCLPTRPVSVVHFHGTDDHTYPYRGLGRKTNPIFPAIPSVMEFWRLKDGCLEHPVLETTYVDGTRVTRESGRDCLASSDVVLYTVWGGTHTWFNPDAGYQPDRAIDATQLMWEFFQAHPLR